MSLERYTRKDGLISFSYRFRYRGRWYRGHIGPKSLRQAKLHEMQARVLAAEGKHPPPKRQQARTSLGPVIIPTFDAFTDRFLAWYATDARPGSVRTYTNRLNVHLLPWFGPRRLTEATTALLDAYRTARRQEGAAPATINGEFTTLSALLRKAVDWDLIPKSARGVIAWLRVEQKPIRVLSAEEESRLLLAATPRLRPLIRFALQTGLRRNELERLTWEDIDLRRREVIIVAHRAKNRRRRVVPLNRAALQILREVAPRHGRVFGYHSIGTVMNEAVERAKLKDVSCHTLRHTWATRCIEAGVNIRTLQRWLGHAKLTTTERYLHPTDRYEREVIERLGDEASQHTGSPSVEEFGFDGWAIGHDDVHG